MKTQFDLLKNCKNATTVWANAETKEIVIANRNSFGYNYQIKTDDEFDEKYGRNLKHNQGKADYTLFYNSAKSMQSCGFKLVKRGEMPLW